MRSQTACDRVSRALFRLADRQNIFYMIPVRGCVKFYLKPLPSPRHLANRVAQALIPPLRLINWSSGSEWHLYFIAYRNADHFDRVRLSTLAGSEVHKITAANGSPQVDVSAFCNRTAQ